MRLLPFLALLFPSFNLSAALNTAIPRWAQAIAVINDALLIYGGKTDQYNTYGYDSAPWNNDLLFLPLSTPFDPSDPPWQYISGSQNTSISSQGPTLAWHTLSAFNSSFSLIFGGSTGPLSNIVLPDNADSAELLDVAQFAAPTFIPVPTGWAGEPQRRMRHAAASANGKIYLIGGEAADGSGNAFSTHYIFTPTVPTFTQLPSENAPPAIFGHAAVILFDGRLLVFGGISQGQLVPLNTIWVLNTTQSTLTWSLASVDGSNLPSPRASFAAVVLDDGRILIQGGSDASFQSNFADGWILDPSRSPMTWTAVPALSQVGARRDHFAISAAGQVMFGFGYGVSAPADPSVQVYDVSSSVFQPTFSPMTAPPAHTTLPPDPSQTVTNQPSASQTPGNRSPSGTGQQSGGPTGSQTGRPPSSTSTGGGGGGGQGKAQLGGSKADTVAIAVGTILGALGLAAGVALIVWYVRRRNAPSGHAFSPLDGDDEDPHSILAVRIGGTREKGPRILAVPLALLGMLGLGPSRRRSNRSRRDILADEDRSFAGIGVSREGSGGRSSFGGPSARSSIRGLSNAVTESFASIRNLTLGAGSAPRPREPSSTVINWEKMGGDPFSPEVALMAEGLARDRLPERNQNGFTQSDRSQPYTDPFSERDASSEVLHECGTEPELEQRGNHAAGSKPTPTPLRTALPPSVDFVPLSPLMEQASQNSLSNSSSSHHTNSDHHTGSGSSHGVGAARSPRPSSILDPNPQPSQPIQRSNSWWARFAKAPLLERRGTESSARNSGGFIDIRDPNPPPRLLTIEESAHSRHPSETPAGATQFLRRPSVIGTADSRARSGTPTRRPSLYHDTSHGRSATSLQTANTDMLEQLGGTMDIIQRDGTLDSHLTPFVGTPYLDEEFGAALATGHSGSLGTGGVQRLRALLVRGESSYHSTRTGSSSASIDSPLMLSPPPSGAVTPNPEFTEPASPPVLEEEEKPEAAAVAAAENGGSGGGPHSPGVTERVRALERRMSRDSAPPPSPTNTRRREERTTSPPPVMARPAVRYGLVPRPSLFVANPDGGGRGSDGG